MLLIDYGKSEVAEYHIVLYQCVCPYNDADLSGCQTFQNLPPLPGLCRAGKHSDLDSGVPEVLYDICIMLTCKHFRRSHNAGLVAVAVSNQGGKHCHHGLSRAHVPLKEAVHLLSAPHVFPDFPDYPLLGICQAVRQCSIALVEGLPDIRHRDAPLIAAPDIFLAEKRELKEEKFLELEPVFGLGQCGLVLRKMNVAQCVIQGYETLLPHDIIRQGLRYCRQPGLEGGCHYPAHDLGCNSGIAKLFRGRVNTCH